MLTEQEWRAVVYRGVALDTVDHNGREHDKRGLFAEQGGVGGRIGVHPEKKAHAAKVLHSVATKENLLKARDSGTDADFGVERSGKVTSGDVASVLHELLKLKGGANGY